MTEMVEMPRMVEEGFEKAGHAILNQTAAVFTGVDAPPTKQYRRGEPSSEILAAAQEANAEANVPVLIVR